MPDSFFTLYAKLLDGKRCCLRLSSVEEFRAFRNALSVSIFRQKKILTSLGMENNGKEYLLRTNFADGVAEFYLEERKTRTFEIFEVEEVDEDNEKERQ